MTTLRTMLSLLSAFGGCIFAARFLSAPDCGCGIPASEVISYDSFPADRFFPEPHVLAISVTGERESVQIGYQENPDDEKDRETILHSVDVGHTWLFQETRSSDSLSVIGAKPAYRIPEGNVLERSLDGVHWSRAQFRIDGLGPDEFARRRAGEADGQAYAQVDLAAVHPFDSRTVYACVQIFSDTRRASDRNGKQVEGSGMYVSYDAGDDWSMLFPQTRARSAEERCTLGISHANPLVMIGHGTEGIVVSRDGGKTWAAVGEQTVLENPAPLNGYTEALAEARLRGGEPFREWPFEWSYLLLVQVEFDPHDEKVVYLLTNKGLYKTENGGNAWCLLNAGTRTLFYLKSLYIDPRDSKRLFVGTPEQVLISIDRGCHFNTFFDWNSYIRRK